MYFYQQNFIYDVSSYSKTKDTTHNAINITIPNSDISNFNYYHNALTRPKILLSTGNFSPWGAKDVLLSDNWTISSFASNYILSSKISNTDITSYDITQIKYLIFLDDIYNLEISSSDTNFGQLKLKNNTILRIKFNNNITKNFYLPSDTILLKTSDYVEIFSEYIALNNAYNFNSNALQVIDLSYNNLNNFPHFINIKLQRPSNTVIRILRLRLILIDKNNTSHTLETYYFSSPSGQTLNTFSVVPLLPASVYHLNPNSFLKLELAWTSDGNTLTTENTSLAIQCIWFLPANNFRIYF
jgi:hypothetical protein